MKPTLMMVLLVAAVGYATEEPPERASPQQVIAVRVEVADRTESGQTQQPEVWLRGVGSWFPDIKFGGDARTFEGRRVGTTDELFWYPLGRDEPEIKVEVSITENLCSQGCVRDMVHLEIWNDRFEVWGTPAVDKKIPR